jgi:hypothetical protein
VKPSTVLYILGFSFSLAGIISEVVEKKRESVWTQADDEAAKEATGNASRDERA